jgi:hypothetical protein
VSELPRITDAVLRVAADLGHGGPVCEYRIESGGGGYAVTLRISSPLPGPGRSHSPPPLNETLAKERRQVEEFLERLTTEFGVCGLGDLRPPYPSLHPTFYTFSFRDSAGESRGFEYQIECSTHLDERYRRLVQEFEAFFETRRAFDRFFQGRRA